MEVKDLKPNFYKFGNKGAVWNNEVHIAQGSEPTTLCGVPMLSTNHARLQGVENIGCKKCLIEYNKINNNET